MCAREELKCGSTREVGRTVPSENDYRGTARELGTPWWPGPRSQTLPSGDVELGKARRSTGGEVNWRVDMKRAAVYARVSTQNGQNPEMQLAEIRQYCVRREWEIAKEYVDKGVSGSKERRPALDELLAACRKRVVDCVVVYRYDRFARSLRQLVNALEDFRALGVDFVSLHEGVDTSTPNGRLVFGIFASIAEFERELICDRVRSGLALAKSRGQRLGRPRVSVDRLQIAKLRANGRTWAEVCDLLEISKGTAQRAVGSLPKNLEEITSLTH
jgi:DNA invertase Pin-like site-specific DNA recombinase